MENRDGTETSAKRNGGRHFCQPPLRRAKDLPVFMNQVPGGPASIVQVHQLRRRFPSPAPSEEEPCLLLECATRRLASLSMPGRPEGQAFRCSAALLGMITPRRPALPVHAPKSASSSVARAEDHLFRRLFPAGFGKEPGGLSPIACRRRSVLPSPAAPSCRCRLSGEAGTSVPIT